MRKAVILSVSESDGPRAAKQHALLDPRGRVVAVDLPGTASGSVPWSRFFRRGDSALWPGTLSTFAADSTILLELSVQRRRADSELLGGARLVPAV